MPLRRLLAVGLWLCVTAAATAIVWAGTSTVAADLTDRPAPVVAHRDVVSALESGASDADTAPGIGVPDTKAPTSTVPADGGGSASAAPLAPAPGPTPSPGPTTTMPVAPSPAPATGGSASPPTTPPPRPHTATYSTTGGVVTVACTNYFFIRLLSATPSNGYSVDVVTPGPAFVEVHFVRAGQDVAVRAFCLGEPTRIYDGFSPPSPVPPRRS
ncbi:MAG: hypothetical protein ACR2LJ_06140 [Acidimicrobiales bacterium]